MVEIFQHESIFYEILEYTIFRRDRSHKSGGGILMYMKNDVEVIQHIKPSFNNSEYQIIHCQFQRTTYLVERSHKRHITEHHGY